jgi:hypothetical protein
VRAHSAKKALVNQGAISASPFLRESARDLISLRRGLNSNYVFFKLSIILSFTSAKSVTKRQRRPGWVALAASWMRLVD